MLHVAAVSGEEGSCVEFFKKMSAEDSLVFDSVSVKLTSAMVQSYEDVFIHPAVVSSFQWSFKCRFLFQPWLLLSDMLMQIL